MIDWRKAYHELSTHKISLIYCIVMIWFKSNNQNIAEVWRDFAFTKVLKKFSLKKFSPFLTAAIRALNENFEEQKSFIRQEKLELQLVSFGARNQIGANSGSNPVTKKKRNISSQNTQTVSVINRQRYVLSISRPPINNRKIWGLLFSADQSRNKQQL